MAIEVNGCGTREAEAVARFINILQKLHGYTAAVFGTTHRQMYLGYILAQRGLAVHDHLGQRGSEAADGACAVIIQGAAAVFIGVEAFVIAVGADAGLVGEAVEIFTDAALHYGDILQVTTCAQGGQVFVFEALPFTLRILLGKGAFLSQQVGGCD